MIHFMAEARPRVDELENIPKGMYEFRTGGSYQRASGDLSYMAFMENYHA